MTPGVGKSQRLDPLAPLPSRSSAWDWVLLTCAVAVAAPLWVGRYLPFADLPEHVAMIATLRHWWDPAWAGQHAFTLTFRHTQYLLYYLVGVLLSLVFGTAERANLVLLTAIAVGLPYSVRSFLRAAGQDERQAIFACPLFWSMPLLIGLLNYVAALPLVVWGLAQTIRQAEQPTLRRGAGLALISVLIFYLHLSALVFFLAASVLCFILWPAPETRQGIARLFADRLSVLWRKLVWMIPAAALCLAWLLTSPVVRPSSIGWSETVGPTTPGLGHAVAKGGGGIDRLAGDGALFFDALRDWLAVVDKLALRDSGGAPAARACARSARNQRLPVALDGGGDRGVGCDRRRGARARVSAGGERF